MVALETDLFGIFDSNLVTWEYTPEDRIERSKSFWDKIAVDVPNDNDL